MRLSGYSQVLKKSRIVVGIWREWMFKEKGPVKALPLEVDGSKKGRPKKMEKSDGMWHDCQRFAKVRCTRS